MAATDLPGEQSLYNTLSPILIQNLQAHQAQYNLPSLDAAVIHILEQYFDDVVVLEHISEPTLPEPINDLNQRITSLGRELVNIRNSVPQEYDRLREQLAAVRLSHSGLLHNLRERIEVIERTLGLNESLPD
ncbi:hypothetical protein RIF25_15850 [Thermosynechococcaceae cyanobacterium BACA0444]|uniref:Uncharacterized protein n=1 Tax=Pseudocalidococcus azoricus BACA0444 TaxID=2918990 RepID=A0AAE4JYK4_9CYAN|nr:hypothetical protein [Pseudocalidococcus azoricus]MDS3862273.1 hypothetical protein [Pseudocalidococcus azoricus BACA0444]